MFNTTFPHTAARSAAALAFLVLLATGQEPRPRQPIATPAPAARSLLIVAPAAFQEALGDYLAFKRERLPTELVSLEAALADPSAAAGVDDPERLKRFLFARWRPGGHGLRYVLLVGDADAMPVRYMVLDRVTAAAFDYAFYPSDLYYADLAKPDGSFDDWNAAKDSFHAAYFGEVRGEKNKSDPINYDQIDYRPDVAVGRWPVSTPDEVRTVAAKTMVYESAIAHGSAPAIHRAAFIATGGWVENRTPFDQMAGHLPAGWTVEKRYFAGGGRDDKTPPPDETQVVALLNEGLSLLVHSGHGADDRWDGSLSVAGIPRLHNQAHPAVMLSAGCSTARFATLPPYEAYVDIDGKEHAGTNAGETFDAPPPPPAPYQKGRYNPTGLGEQLLRAGPSGAVAYIGCNTGSQPCGMTLLEGFVDALSQTCPEPPRLGDCWAAAIAYYYDKQNLANLKPNADWYPPSIFFQGMKFLLFGDPSAPMPARPEP